MCRSGGKERCRHWWGGCVPGMLEAFVMIETRSASALVEFTDVVGLFGAFSTLHHRNDEAGERSRLVFRDHFQVSRCGLMRGGDLLGVVAHAIHQSQDVFSSWPCERSNPTPSLSDDHDQERGAVNGQ